MEIYPCSHPKNDGNRPSKAKTGTGLLSIIYNSKDARGSLNGRLAGKLAHKPWHRHTTRSKPAEPTPNPQGGLR